MYVTATGMVCSVGLNAAAACAAMRAGIANFTELPYHDNQGEPIIGAMVPGLSSDLKQDECLIEMLLMAITDCLKDKQSEPMDKIPLLIGLAEQGRTGGSAGFATSIIGQVQKKMGIRFHPTLSRVITKGHTSGFEALWLVREIWKTGGISSCLVCGVDSYINADSLLWLEQHWRLKTLNNSDGVIPGEAAAAVLLQPEPAFNKAVKVKIVGLGFGYERAGVFSEDPLLGIGLKDAAQVALTEAGTEIHEIAFRLSDVTGESYGFKEQSLMLSKLLKIRRECQPLWHYAASIGDIGAAAGICELVITKQAVTKQYAPGSRALCCTSSVFGERAVAVIQRLFAKTNVNA